jgi:DnaJ-domain-containing protein 1
MPTTVSSAIAVLNNAGDAKLKNYYLDWTNYKNTNAQDVYNLLNAFWQRYSQSHYNNKDKALADLGLANKVKQKEITQQYKKLANQYHPDKGGDEQQFIKIKKAYDALKTEFTKEKHIEIIN